MSTFNKFIKKREYQDYINNFKKACKDNPYSREVESVGSVGGLDLLKVVINPSGKTPICFVSGIHGNEEAGPYGVLEFVKSNMRIPSSVKVIILPLCNPSGFLNNTRENDSNVDINREFVDGKLNNECKIIWNAIKNEKIELLHTLHEDPELKQFYLYYTHHEDLAEGIRDMAKYKGFQIFNKEHRSPIEGEERNSSVKDKIKNGIIPLPHTARNSLEDLALNKYNIPYITTETPGKLHLKKRVDFNKDIIKYVIHNI